jgi:hypothetical protein
MRVSWSWPSLNAHETRIVFGSEEGTMKNKKAALFLTGGGLVNLTSHFMGDNLGNHL